MGATSTNPFPLFHIKTTTLFNRQSPFLSFTAKSTAVMAKVVDDVDFCLSTPQILSYKTPPLTMNKAVGGAAFSRSAEAEAKLTYELRFKSELGSPVQLVNTCHSEENDFFVELNRRLMLSERINVAPLDLSQPSQVSKAIGGSPQSILGGIGSWSDRSSNQSPPQGLSPPATPYGAEYDTKHLIYAAAGQIKQLKMSSETTLNPKREHNHKAGLIAEQNHLAATIHAYNAALLYERQLRILANSSRCTKPVTGLNYDLLTESSRMLQHQNQHRVCNKTGFQPAPIQRRESVGTGVFLPRRYNTSPAIPPRKRTVTTNDIVPAKVVQTLNFGFEELNCQTQPHYSAYAASMSYKSYEALMAKRNAFLAQQQQRVAKADDICLSNLEVCLPQEWIY